MAINILCNHHLFACAYTHEHILYSLMYHICCLIRPDTDLQFLTWLCTPDAFYNDNYKPVVLPAHCT